MWASGTRLEGTCGSNILSIDWMEARDSSGGWLATGCASGTVGVSWVSYKRDVESTDSISKEETREDQPLQENIALAREGSLFKSHFILRGHIGEVRMFL